MVKAKKKTKKKSKNRGVVDRATKPSRPPRNAKGQLLSGWGRGSKQIKKKVKKKELPKREANGRLLPGYTANVTGKNTNVSRMDALNAAIRRVEDSKDQSFLDMCVEKAWDDTAMAIAILRKKHPDLKAIEMLTVATDSMADEEAEKIRKEVASRFGD